MIRSIAPLPEPFLDADHEAFRGRLRDSWRTRLEDVQARFDRGAFDEDAAARAFVQALATDGLLAEAVGGDVRRLCVAREEAALVSGFGDNQLALQGLGSHPIRLDGSAELRARYLEPAARGEKLAAFALTEEEAGSDAAALQTSAKREGADYVVHGKKTLITNAGIADFYTVFCRLHGTDQMMALVVDAGSEGLRVAERFRVMAPHPIGSLVFDGCRVPVANRLGTEGEGLRLAFRTLDRFRPSVGAAAVGLASRALAEARHHAGQRQQFGRPLARFQVLRALLGDSWNELELSRLSVLRAAWLQDTQAGGRGHSAAAAMAKLTATESAGRIIDRAVQIFGGRGVVQGEIAERLYRECRALRIYEGTSEIQRLILSRELLEGSGTAGEGSA